MRVGEPRSDVLPTPPEPPAGFELLSVPVPMLTISDERWIAAAQGAEGFGMLIYEHHKKVCFLIPDEAAIVYATISEQSRWLVTHLQPIDNRHRRLIDELRWYWHMLPARELEDGGPQQ